MTDNPKCAEYEFRSDKEKFYDAKRKCTKKGMKLLTHFQGHYDALRDCRKDEDKYWIGLVQRRKSQCFLNSSLYFWVGNQKRCVNPKTELQNIGNGNEQPLNENEECQAIVITLSKQRASDTYDSKKCDLNHKYICQKQLNNPSSTDSGKTSSTPQSYFPSHKSPPSEETTTHFKNANPPSNVAMLVVIGVLVSLIVLLFVLIFRRSKKWKTLCKSNKKATKRTETEEPIYSRYGL